MTLRSKLTVAFFAISVVPLSAVTLYSYVSSERAVRQAAERQADELAAELGHRMQWVTSDLERRLNGAWPQPDTRQAGRRADQGQGQRQASARRPDGQPGRRPGPARGGAAPDPAAPTPEQTMAGHLAGVLGDIAPIVDAVEFAPPAPPAPPVPAGAASGTARVRPEPPPPPGGAPAPSGEQPARVTASTDTGRIVIQGSEVMAEAARQVAAARDTAGWAQALQVQITQGVAGMVRNGSPGGRQPARAGGTGTGQPPRGSSSTTRTTTVMRGGAVRTEIQQDGRTVGRITARLNAERLFRAVLSMSRREAEEIPFAVDADGHVHSPRSEDRGVIESLQIAAPPSSSPEGVVVRSVKDWVVATRQDPSGATIGIARPIGEDLRGLRRAAARNFFVGFGLIALVFVASVPLAAGMTRNLRTLMDGVQRLSRGELAWRVKVSSRDEFGRLGAAFNQMAENLAAHEQLVVQQERIRRELELCRQIQNEMLPRQPLRLGLTEVKGLSIPAREVGGDFFNYFALPDGRIALVVGDVSGKGVGAALLMANVQATLQARLPVDSDLARLADTLDRELALSTPPEVYLTLFVGVLDPARRELRYVNAGHNTQFVLHEGADLGRMASTGRPLGLLAGNGYEEVRVTLDEGDILFFYTDGMVEAENETGDVFGADRLEALLLDSPRGDVDTVLARVEDAVRSFRGRVELADDATLMALRFGPAGPVLG
jgi:serine phosphatase RsbU (regulator of sigma subunit)